jgi:hypothetical protein
MLTVTDDAPNGIRFGAGIAPFLATLPRAPVPDGNRPRMEQVAAEPHFIAAVMILLGVVRVEGDGEQIVHRESFRMRSRRRWAAGGTGRASPG